MSPVTKDICDMSYDIIATGMGMTMTCNQVFVCGTVTAYPGEGLVTLTTDSIYIGDGATIKNFAVDPRYRKILMGFQQDPVKRLHCISVTDNGRDGWTAGADGEHGKDGTSGFNMTLTANRTLPGSSSSINFISRGNDGGNGGNGQPGLDNRHKIPTSVPTNAKEVVQHNNTKHVSVSLSLTLTA